MTGMQVSNDKRLKLVTGRAHPELADQVAAELGIDLLPVSAYDFANSEIYVRFEESIRGADVFILQFDPAPINKWLMEQLIMIDAPSGPPPSASPPLLPTIPTRARTRSIRGASRSPRVWLRTYSRPLAPIAS